MKTIFKTLLESVDASVTVSSEPMKMDQIYCYSLQTKYVGTAAGTILIEVSNDWIESGDTNPKPLTWAPLQTATTLSSASQVINIDGAGYAWMRITFTAAGTGTLSVKYCGKGN